MQVLGKRIQWASFEITSILFEAIQNATHDFIKLCFFVLNHVSKSHFIVYMHKIYLYSELHKSATLVHMIMCIHKLKWREASMIMKRGNIYRGCTLSKTALFTCSITTNQKEKEWKDLEAVSVASYLFHFYSPL